MTYPRGQARRVVYGAAMIAVSLVMAGGAQGRGGRRAAPAVETPRTVILGQIGRAHV